MPDQAVTAATALLLLGGASILLGAKPKIGTAAVIAFLAAVSPMMHDFWTQQDPSQRQNDMVHFSKNMALLGAAIALMGINEPWPASVPLLK
jgi:putative oxidoreductase